MHRSLESRGGLRAVPGAASAGAGLMLILYMLLQPAVVHAGKLSWLDDVVQEVIIEAKAGGKGLVRGGDAARAEIRGAGRLFRGSQRR